MHKTRRTENKTKATPQVDRPIGERDKEEQVDDENRCW